MSSYLIRIADAVALALNEAPQIAPGYTAVRTHAQISDLETISAGLLVSVIPALREYTPETRSSDHVRISVDVVVQSRVDPYNQEASIVSMQDVVEETARRLSRRSLALDAGYAAFEGIENDPALLPEHLTQYSVFTSVIRATYRIEIGD